MVTARKCKACGAKLSSHNPAKLCWPCQEKKKEELKESIGDSPHYTVDNLCFILGLASRESVKRLGRTGKIPGRVPRVRQHLYIRQEVDQWIRGEPQESQKVIENKDISEDISQDARLAEHFDQIATIAKLLASNVQKPLYSKSKDIPYRQLPYRGDIVKGFRSYWGSPDDARVIAVEPYVARCVFVHYEDRFGKLSIDCWEDIADTAIENASQEIADNLVRLAHSQTFKPCPRCPVCVELAGIEPVSPDSIPVVDGKTGKVWYTQPMPPDF